MDPQRRHDQGLRIPEVEKIMPRAELEALLRKINGPSMEPSLPGTNGPIASAMESHPGLTKEEAIAMAEAFGFL